MNGYTGGVVWAETGAERGRDKKVVRVDVGRPQCAYVKDARRMSSIYHNMINLVLSQVVLWILWCWNLVLVITMFCTASKDTSLKPLSLVFSCRLCFPTVGPKIPSLATFALKSPTSILYRIWGICYTEFVVQGILGCVILIPYYYS